MNDSVIQFLAHYTDGRFSPRTVELYGMILHRFVEFCQENAVGNEVGKNDVRLFLAQVAETNNPVSTNQYLAVMRIFFAWIQGRQTSD